MKNQIRSFLLASLAVLGAFPTAASAMVMALPSYYDFGPVQPNRIAMTTITFMNNSGTLIPFFNVNCSGDSSVFACFSMCSVLPAYGSCAVQVQFMPRNGDDLRKMVWVSGSGGGEFSSATVYGTDAKTAK